MGGKAPGVGLLHGYGPGYRGLWRKQEGIPHLAVFSFPEVRWQFTKPNEVPLNMKETPTAPLFPVRVSKKKHLCHL